LKTFGLCVFLNRRETFEDLQHWLEEVVQNADEGIIRILIGNQADEVDGLQR